MVLRHFCKQPRSKRASSGLSIQLLHPQTDQLGICSEEKISRSADSSNKNWLQISLLLRNTSLHDGPPNNNATSRRQSCNHYPSTHIWRHTLPIWVGNNVRVDLGFGEWIVEVQRMGSTYLTHVGPSRYPNTRILWQRHTFCNGKGIDRRHPSWSLRLRRCLHQQHEWTHHQSPQDTQHRQTWSGNPPCYQSSSLAKWHQQTYPPGAHGGAEKVKSRGGVSGDENYSWMALKLSHTHGNPPQAKTHRVVQQNSNNDSNR